MKLNKKKLEIYGLYFGCPEIKPLDTCPFKKYRKGSAVEKLKLLEKMPDEEIDHILRQHHKCLLKRMETNLLQPVL
ncbi:MAG: hypothetical protein ACOC11_02195 [Prolixibacteraceae bacterium]